MIRHANPLVQAACDEVATALSQLEPHFTPEMQLTFVAVDPDDPEKDLVITGGDLRAARDAIERSTERGPG